MTDERKPGPPTSGQVGEYHVRFHRIDWETTAYWDGDCYTSYSMGAEDEYYVDETPPDDVIPLHDFPLVPGDEVEKLRAELESTREACRLAVAQQAKEDDEVEKLKADADRREREAFEAGRSSYYGGELVLGYEEDFKYQTFEYYKEARDAN